MLPCRGVREPACPPRSTAALEPDVADLAQIIETIAKLGYRAWR